MSEPAQRLFEALVGSDPAAAIAVVEEVRDGGMERERLFDELFVPAMSELGRAWAQGELDEMGFTQAAVVAEQMTSFVAPQAATADTGVTVLIGCAQGESHSIARNLLVAVLKESGHRVIDLGVDARGAEFLEKVEETSARIVIVCVEMAGSIGAVEDLRDLLDSAGHGDAILLVAGGPFVADPGLARRLGADGVLAGAESALRIVTRVAADLERERDES